MKTRDEVVEIIQAEIDASEEGIDLLDYIYLCDELNEKEKEWALSNLGVSIPIVRI